MQKQEINHKNIIDVQERNIARNNYFLGSWIITIKPFADISIPKENTILGVSLVRSCGGRRKKNATKDM